MHVGPHTWLHLGTHHCVLSFFKFALTFHLCFCVLSIPIKVLFSLSEMRQDKKYFITK